MILPTESEVREHVRAVFGEMAREAAADRSGATPWVQSHVLEVEPGTTQFEGAASKRLTRRIGLTEQQSEQRYPLLSHVLRSVFIQAQALGFVVPGSCSEPLAFHGSHLRFTFTLKGIAHYTGQVELEVRGSLDRALQALDGRVPGAAGPPQRVLLNEAQLCWVQGCYRAATILVGVGSEEALGGLADALMDAYPGQSRPAGGAALVGAWRDLAPGRSIGSRMRACLSLLRRIYDALSGTAHAERQRTGSFPAWSTHLENVECLGGLVEAIRLARNEAAHDELALVDQHDVSLLLGSTPALLEKIAEIRAFLRSPPMSLPPL